TLQKRLTEERREKWIKERRRQRRLLLRQEEDEDQEEESLAAFYGREYGRDQCEGEEEGILAFRRDRERKEEDVIFHSSYSPRLLFKDDKNERGFACVSRRNIERKPLPILRSQTLSPRLRASSGREREGRRSTREEEERRRAEEGEEEYTTRSNRPFSCTSPKTLSRRGYPLSRLTVEQENSERPFSHAAREEMSPSSSVLLCPSSRPISSPCLGGLHERRRKNLSERRREGRGGGEGYPQRWVALSSPDAEKQEKKREAVLTIRICRERHRQLEAEEAEALASASLSLSEKEEEEERRRRDKSTQPTRIASSPCQRADAFFSSSSSLPRKHPSSSSSSRVLLPQGDTKQRGRREERDHLREDPCDSIGLERDDPFSGKWSSSLREKGMKKKSFPCDRLIRAEKRLKPLESFANHPFLSRNAKLERILLEVRTHLRQYEEEQGETEKDEEEKKKKNEINEKYKGKIDFPKISLERSQKEREESHHVVLLHREREKEEDEGCSFSSSRKEKSSSSSTTIIDSSSPTQHVDAADIPSPPSTSYQKSSSSPPPNVDVLSTTSLSSSSSSSALLFSSTFSEELEAFCKIRGVKRCDHKEHHPDLPFYFPLSDLCDAAVKLQRWVRYVYHRRRCKVKLKEMWRRRQYAILLQATKRALISWMKYRMLTRHDEATMLENRRKIEKLRELAERRTKITVLGNRVGLGAGGSSSPSSSSSKQLREPYFETKRMLVRLPFTYRCHSFSTRKDIEKQQSQLQATLKQIQILKHQQKQKKNSRQIWM
ncbi:iq calmodulin-binding motif domain-containing protein, partial [Cystoisospora suis]